MSESNLSDKIIIREGATIMLVSSDALKVEDVREAVQKLKVEMEKEELLFDLEDKIVFQSILNKIFGTQLVGENK